MKKLILSLIVALTSVTGLMAQSITVTEPEFAEETLLLTSDSQGVKLSRENGTIKTKAGASLYLTGIGKVKSRLTLKGIKSTSKAVGGSTTRLIIKAADNKTDPNSFISILSLKLKVKSVDTSWQRLVLCQRLRVTTFQVLNIKPRNMVRVLTI